MQQSPNITVRSGILHYLSFEICPHFHRTPRRPRSSIQFRARVSRVLDHRSERLTENAAYTMFRRSAPLGPIQLDVVECRWHSKTSPRQELPGPYSGSQFGTTYLSTLPRSQPLVVVVATHFLLTIIGILAARSPLVASIGTPPFNVNPFTCRGRLRHNRKAMGTSMLCCAHLEVGTCRL